MSQYNDRETLSTLRFGLRAKSIKNAIKQNSQRSAKELQSLLTGAEKKIKQNNDLIQMIQAKLKESLNIECPFDEIKNKLSIIYTATDLEILYAVLTGSKEDKLVQEIEKQVLK